MAEDVTRCERRPRWPREAWKALVGGISALAVGAALVVRAADYLGGGQSGEVNAFLNPEAVSVRDGFGDLILKVPITHAVTLVPAVAGQGEADLEFRFGAGADPATFHASLGKLALNLADLSQEGVRVVDVPFSPGRNTVTAAVVGLRESGGRARDMDRITLLCCVGPNEQPPVADAGDDFALVSGMHTRLDGRRSSDPNGDSLTYAWEQVGGLPVTLSDPSSATPTFIAPFVLDGPVTVLEFELTVNDGFWTSFADRVQVTVLAGTVPAPIADAGPDQFATPMAIVTLDGSGSYDPSGLPIECRWSSQGDVIPLIVPPDTDGCIATFLAPDVSGSATFFFQLTVTNLAGLMAFDTTTVTVLGEQLVVAVAGPDQVAVSGAEVTLDGTNSSAPDGGPLECRWDPVGWPIEPVGLPVTGCIVTIIAPEIPGTGSPQQSIVTEVMLVIQLTVTSSAGLSDIDEMILTVVSP